MKNIYCLLVIAMPFIAGAQTTQIAAFNGIKFGSSPSDAAEALKASGAGTSYNEMEGLLFLYNLKYGGLISKQACFKFVDNQFYESVVEFPVDRTNFLKAFNQLKFLLTKDYGYGKDMSWFDSPYYFGDGQEFDAISERKGRLCHAWSKSRQVVGSDFIVLEVVENGTLRMVFQNHHYASLAANKKRLQLSAKN